MPLYEYQCESCGAVFEVKQKFSDAPLSTHDSCGGPVRRLLSPPALQFKGSGWYITDYARGNGGSAKKESKEKAGAGTESTPAAKKEAAGASKDSSK